MRRHACSGVSRTVTAVHLAPSRIIIVWWLPAASCWRFWGGEDSSRSRLHCIALSVRASQPALLWACSVLAVTRGCRTVLCYYRACSPLLLLPWSLTACLLHWLVRRLCCLSVGAHHQRMPRGACRVVVWWWSARAAAVGGLGVLCVVDGRGLVCSQLLWSLTFAVHARCVKLKCNVTLKCNGELADATPPASRHCWPPHAAPRP